LIGEGSPILHTSLKEEAGKNEEVEKVAELAIVDESSYVRPPE